jgi:hypothetical protein
MPWWLHIMYVVSEAFSRHFAYPNVDLQVCEGTERRVVK